MGCKHCLLSISLKSLSMVVVLDFLHEFTNTIVLSLFHNRMWPSGYSEVDVNLVYHWTLWSWANNGSLRSIAICFFFQIEVRAVTRKTWMRHSLWADNGSPRSIVVHIFFTRETCFDFLRTIRSFWADNGSPSSIMIWIWVWWGWLGTFCLSSNFSFWLSSNFWTQFLHLIMFQGNLWRRPRWHIYFFVFDLTSFHPNNFRDTNIIISKSNGK